MTMNKSPEKIDWSTVPLDPSKMSDRDREGFEYLVDFIAKAVERLGIGACRKDQPKSA